MYIVEYCRAPSKLWVGKVVHNNGTYYSYGRTLDQMIKNIKNRLYNRARVSQSSVILSSNQTPTESFETKYMSKIFHSKYWVDKNGNNSTMPVTKPVDTPNRENTQTYDSYEYKVVDGKLIVYGVVKVAEYNLTKTEVETESQTQSQTQQPIGIINLGNDSTQSVPDVEIPMEYTAE